MKLSIKQKQKIYEHLLALDCPDLLAALIAERCSVYYVSDVLHESSLAECVCLFELWNLTPEGYEFWEPIYEELTGIVKFTEVGDEIEIDTSKPKISIELIPPVDYSIDDVVRYEGKELRCTGRSQGGTEAELTPKLLKSYWNKVKLFFGKLFYGV